MRIRTAAISTGIATLALCGLSAPAHAASQSPASAQASWINVAEYGSKKACVDAGQQYEREGWHAYKCPYVPLESFPYQLWIR